MSDFANRLLTLATFAGIAGLVLFNYKAADALFHTTSQATNGYIKTIQGR